MSITLFLIFLMLFTFAIQDSFNLLPYFSFIPHYAIVQPWRFVTSIFLHANFPHLFYNILALFFFGHYLERIISKKSFLLIFFLSGIFGNLLFFLTTSNALSLAVGASGAIYGIVGALAALRPFAIVYVYFTPVPLITMAFIWAFLSFLGIFVPSNIAHAAHFSGLVTGYVLGRYIGERGRKFKRG